LNSTVQKLHPILYIEAEFVIPKPGAGLKLAMEKAQALLHVTCPVDHPSVGPRGYPERIAPQPRIKPHVDLVVVIIRAGGQQSLNGPKILRPDVLRVAALLKPGVVLLDAITVHWIVQEKGEVRIEIEQRPRNKSVQLPHTAIRPLVAEISRAGSHADSSAIGWVDVAKAIEPSRSYLIEGYLAGGIKIVRSGVQAKAVTGRGG